MLKDVNTMAYLLLNLCLEIFQHQNLSRLISNYIEYGFNFFTTVVGNVRTHETVCSYVHYFEKDQEHGPNM